MTHKAEVVLYNYVWIAEFTYSPGRDACGPAYDHGGLPAEPPEIEVLKLFDGYGVEADMSDEEHEEITNYLFENWEPPTGPDPDDERDRRRDDALTMGDE